MATHPSHPDATPRSELGSPLDGGGGGADELISVSVTMGRDPPYPPAEPVTMGEALPYPPAEPAAFRHLVNSASSEASIKEARRREAEEDRELISLAQNGDKAAFRHLVERHQRAAHAVAMGLVRDENDARELVQEAFLRVHRGLKSFQGGSSFFTWLYRIVTNLAIDLMRKPGRRDAELDENHAVGEAHEDFPLVSRIDGADPIDVMRRREIAQRIQSALDDLPAIHRGVILMREVEGMSYEEMAQAMGVSKGTIMSRLFHARQKMQRALADCYAEDGPRVTTPADLDASEEKVS